MKKSFYIIYGILLFGCENEFTPSYTFAWEPPVVTSVVISSFGSTESHNLNVWNYGGPITTISFSEIKDFYVNSNPLYINPESDEVGPIARIYYDVPTSSRVKLSIMPARSPNEDLNEVVQRFAGTTFERLNSGGLILLDQRSNAGTHSVVFNPYGLKLPSGFYLYVLQVGSFTQTREIYIANNCNEALPELRQFILECVNED